MKRPRAAAVVTWTYAAMFGAPAVPVAIFGVARVALVALAWQKLDGSRSLP